MSNNPTPSDDTDYINYRAEHEAGDTGKVPAPMASHDDARDHHEIELYDPPGSVGIGLKWRCERCNRFYGNPKLFEDDPCIPFKER